MSPAGRTGVVVALAAEARCLGPGIRGGVSALAGGHLVIIGGVGAAHAQRAAQRLLDAGATALLSWGVAGALDPRLTCGTVLLATRVLPADRSQPVLPASESWRECLAGALAGRVTLVQGPLLGSATPIARPEDKARLFTATGALAVDMESAAIAALAVARSLPFMAVRAVVDTAADVIPPAAVRALEPSVVPAWLPLLAAPASWPALLRLQRRFRQACDSLRSCAPIALPATP